VRATAVLGLFVGAAIFVYASPRWGVGVALGSVWAAVNLWLIAHVVRLTARPGERTGRDKLHIALAFAIKFPVLYLAGWLLLRWEYAPALSLLVGFGTMFVVTTLKALGRAMLKLDDNRVTSL
jgi:hypothetical protein